MDAIELKEYIIKNNKIEFILEKLECHSIDSKDKEWIYCAFKDGDNKKGISINKENLSFNSFTRGVKGDIFSLISYIKGIEFSQCIKFLHEILGLKNSKRKANIETIDPLSKFKKMTKNNYIEFDVLEHKSEDCLNDFIPYLTKDWIVENGILEPIRSRFDLGYSPSNRRITIPHREWCSGKLVGVIGRTTNELYKELNIPKYFPIIKYNKSNNLYGLFENYLDIQSNGYVVVYESEKSVIRRSARLDNTGVSIGCKTISRQQAHILKNLGVEIVIAFDKDVSLVENLNACSLFFPNHKVSFIKDKFDILGDKDSPADANMENFNKLFNNRSTYNEEWENIRLNLIKRGL